MAVKPLEDRVLVKQSEAEEKTAGGIVLRDHPEYEAQALVRMEQECGAGEIEMRGGALITASSDTAGRRAAGRATIREKGTCFTGQGQAAGQCACFH
jgi:hypothetical protein